MVGASAHRPHGPGIIYVKGKGRIYRQNRMKRLGRAPGLEPHGADARPGRPAFGHGHRAMVAHHLIAVLCGGRHLHLKPFDRAVSITHRSADGAGFAKHMPGFERLTEFKMRAFSLHLAAEREAELRLRFVPHGIEVKAMLSQIAQDRQEVFPEEMGQHVAVMQHRAPTNRARLHRVTP